MHNKIFFTDEQELIISRTYDYMRGRFMIKEEDYDIYPVEYCKIDYTDKKIVIKLQFKDEPRIIEDMELIGWTIEARYKNDNGSPSKFYNDEFDDCFGDFGDYNMVRMRIG